MMWSKKQVCNLVDLTSLNTYDSEESILAFLENARNLEQKGYPVAAVCVFPNFAEIAVKELADSSVKVAVVAGNFPNAQGLLTTRLLECENALKAGVDEVDIVLNLGAFRAGKHQQVIEEVAAFKRLMPHKTLKVILETGYLKTEERIQTASRLAIAGGADFIKTSTGKDFPGANPTAVEAMVKVVNEERIYTEKEVGIKVSGGVRSYEAALEYIAIVEKFLGDEFITKEQFRIGASSLVADLTNE